MRGRCFADAASERTLALYASSLQRAHPRRATARAAPPVGGPVCTLFTSLTQADVLGKHRGVMVERY